MNAKNDYSRIRTATRSNCGFLCLFIRQVARFVKLGNSSQRSCRSNASNIQILRLRSWLVVLFRAHFIDFSFDGQTHPARDRLRRLGIEPLGVPPFGAQKGGGLKFRVFFSSPAPIFALFVSLWVSSRGILVVFSKAGALKCARLEFSGCRVTELKR